MSTHLLGIHPPELGFTFEAKKQLSCVMHLANVTDQYVAFKVKTSSPEKYCVRPNISIIKPKSACDCTVTMQAQRSAPSDMKCKDKFMIQSTIVPFGTNDITSAAFAEYCANQVEENMLKVVLVSSPHSPVLLPHNGDSKQEPLEGISKQERNTSTKLLDIHPFDLEFTFEARKQSSCMMHLTNVSDQYVAFKVKITSPKEYTVRPNIGIIKPKSACVVTVTKQAHKSAPPDMQCKDKFMIQSTIAPSGTNQGDITPDLFLKDGANYIEEIKLGVILVSKAADIDQEEFVSKFHNHPCDISTPSFPVFPQFRKQEETLSKPLPEPLLQKDKPPEGVESLLPPPSHRVSSLIDSTFNFFRRVWVNLHLVSPFRYKRVSRSPSFGAF